MMKQIKQALCAAAIAVMSSGAHALVIHTDVFQVGCTSSPGNCTSNGNATFSASPNWLMNYDGSLGAVVTAFLHINAEGIDLGENDGVVFNGTAIGSLTQQAFAAPTFGLTLGAGALAGVTEITSSVFDVSSLITIGNNSVTINVDPGNWINEIETAELIITTSRNVPEPAGLALVGAGMLGAASFSGRRRRG
ncbi:MAG: PEP-CTERM sorting domain-containing protein [Gammaproteobacteria bacterium]|nr:PEP-CTERM sorting domain-containing protein [Gammaproteobacteria bacterium]